MSENQIGQFDSWEIISEDFARKKCDLSFFRYQGSGLPQKVRWFFKAEGLQLGQKQDLILIYNGVEYEALIRKESSASARTRIFWSSLLGQEFARYNGDGIQHILEFHRMGEYKYEIKLVEETDAKTTESSMAKKELIRNALEKLMKGYPVYDTGLIDRSKYLIVGSVGQGNWAMVPWICIFDKSITTSATKGVYIVYLLAKDCSKLYLTFNQGCTEIRKANSKKETITIMRMKAKEIAQKINNRGFAYDENISLGNGLTELGELYQKGTIFYKEYQINNIPSEEELTTDLSKMMDIYKEYALPDGGDLPITPYQEKKQKVTEKEAIEYIKSYISSRGFTYSDGMIENFYLSLKSKPFVILAGTSGTGKTKLVELFAAAIGAEYSLVSVRPDWSDGGDLFGHNDLNGDFVRGPVCEAFDKAIDEPDRPVFLCLDEMNLARVEYYLSDFLSVIESRKKSDNGRIKTKPIAQYDDGIPENLYFIGTVNMDETTFPFSKKVLDRANTIEFNYVELLPDFRTANENQERINVTNSFLKTENLVLALDCIDEKEYVIDVCNKLQQINEILRKANAHVGYRVRDEIVFYMLNNKKAGNLLTEEQAFDNEIMQKILPRIQGSAVSIKKMLIKLFKFCMGNQSVLDQDNGNVGTQMNNMADSATYKESAKKIGYMMTRYEEDGFTSYWL